MPAVLFMCISVLAWSLYPLGAVMSLKTMNSLELVTVTMFLTALGVTILGLIHFSRKNKFSNIIQKHKELNKAALYHYICLWCNKRHLSQPVFF